MKKKVRKDNMETYVKIKASINEMTNEVLEEELDDNPLFELRSYDASDVPNIDDISSDEKIIYNCLVRTSDDVKIEKRDKPYTFDEINDIIQKKEKELDESELNNIVKKYPDESREFVEERLGYTVFDIMDSDSDYDYLNEYLNHLRNNVCDGDYIKLINKANFINPSNCESEGVEASIYTVNNEEVPFEFNGYNSYEEALVDTIVKEDAVQDFQNYLENAKTEENVEDER